ncbi:hypothetical protein H9623_12000 [Oerskovia sp. Sa1BUA8]|uniref:Uncharacterized protein n=1 Tax=Oerskovia douganii TaxID=2762210 RepID=A0A9D5UI75_9CELL|nr:hypothetical protein [Oerskovia douganii]MBE7701022.1 hypothetical protein [Oerskovia douganii]
MSDQPSAPTRPAPLPRRRPAPPTTARPLPRRRATPPAPDTFVRVVTVADVQVSNPAAVLAAAAAVGWSPGAGSDAERLRSALEHLAADRAALDGARVLATSSTAQALDLTAGDALADESPELAAWVNAQAG